MSDPFDDKAAKTVEAGPGLELPWPSDQFPSQADVRRLPPEVYTGLLARRLRRLQPWFLKTPLARFAPSLDKALTLLEAASTGKMILHHRDGAYYRCGLDAAAEAADKERMVFVNKSRDGEINDEETARMRELLHGPESIMRIVGDAIHREEVMNLCATWKGLGEMGCPEPWGREIIADFAKVVSYCHEFRCNQADFGFTIDEHFRWDT